MDKVVLKIKEIELGFLVKEQSDFIFIANESNIKLAYKKYPLLMRMFTLNEKGKKDYKFLPYPFSLVRDSFLRSDIIIKADLKEDDDDFVKLFKVAGLDLEIPNFIICQG